MSEPVRPVLPARGAVEPPVEPVRSAQRVVEGLQANGVPYVFGIPGAKIDAVYDALADAGPQVVVCRHEQNAVFMAAAVGRLTGVPGVVLVTSGPGTSNLATGLLTATTEQDPVVALCGAVSRADRLKRTHQSMDATALLAAVTKAAGEVSHPDNVPEALANAFRVALTEPRGAAAVVLPADVAAEPTRAVIRESLPVPPVGPAPGEQVRRAAELLRSARNPVLLVGARGAEPAACPSIRTLISGTALPVIETFQAAGVVSRDLESHYLGRVGLFRNQPADALAATADVILTVGYDPVEYDPVLWNPEASRTIVHVDAVPAEIDNHYQPALELRGDIAATLAELARELGPMPPTAEAEAAVAAHRARLTAIDEEARTRPGTERGLDPAAVCLRLRDHLDDEATIACDIGSVYIHMARHFRVYEPRRLLFSNGQQTLGVALPWAMAATLVRPGTQVVSVSGDGGFLFSAQELETATRLGLAFVHVIFRDNTYDMVGFQQVLKYGRKSGVTLGDYDTVAFAEAFGARGVRVTTMAEFDDALRAGLAADRPTIIDVPVDYSGNTELGEHLIRGAFA
ncbi:acetolactate synthase AlsS [Streptomyces justiciae]|uniref:acetolactate synthase AlsS n=1 Tax=Streptomyces justiciae TaxID=2780140 RepID=UPI002117DE82|nr:acetolactate synthase AlsS [Streptomyces justiciae]MCW8383884.1 acetolactate synthase AlsS [Streptomyces justiciae]